MNCTVQDYQSLSQSTQKSVDQSPSSEDNSYSTCQKIPRLLHILNIHYHIHEKLQMDPNLSQMNPVHILLSDFNIVPLYIKIS
jgi:hypothetical protein